MRWPLKILFGLVLVGFAAAITGVLLLRFEAGDIYPPYSSLRTDPLGAKAFYESLGELEGMRIERNYLDMIRAQSWNAPGGRSAPPAVVLFLGVKSDDLHVSDRDADDLDEICKAGGRVVIALTPQKPGQIERMSRYAASMASSRAIGSELGRRWGFRIEQHDLGPLALPVGGAKEPMSWHNQESFEELDKAWRKLYEVDGHPVLIERPMGGGSIVLCGDSYAFSNEALRNEPHAALLARIVGDYRRAIFDECHLGVREDPGAAALARKYRLQWVLVVAVVLALLFIWKNATSLTPPQSGQADRTGGSVAGRAAAEGLVNLLRRSMPPGEALAVCVQEWRGSLALQGPEAAKWKAKLSQVEQVLDACRKQDRKKQDVVQAYLDIAKIVNKRNF